MAEKEYRGITISRFIIPFDKVLYVEFFDDGSSNPENTTVAVYFSFSQHNYISIKKQDAINFYNAYRAWLGYSPEADESQEGLF